MSQLLWGDLLFGKPTMTNGTDAAEVRFVTLVVIPISSFIFMLSALATLDQIRSNRSWIGLGLLASLSFAVFMGGFMVVLASASAF